MKITDEMIRRLCSETMYRRGNEYFHQGRVHINKHGDDGISAIVDGESVYTVRIMFDKDKISDAFCTCPYYTTMQAPCKHIAATLKKYQSDLDTKKSFVDDNDVIALNLCKKFEKSFSPKKRLNASFTFYAHTIGGYKYSVGIAVGEDEPVFPADCEGFISAYTNGTELRLSKNFVYSRDLYYFGDTETQVLDILAECCETKQASKVFYSSQSAQMNITSLTANRLLDLLVRTGFEFVLNGLNMQGIRIHRENPDIIVEFSSSAGDICMSSPDFGLSLTKGGEWFVFEGDLYRTERTWREWYMPIYDALTGNSRTQLRFCGANTMAFACEMLPHIKNRHGIEISGIKELIVDDKPIFEIYLDSIASGINAMIKAVYGDVQLMFPESAINDESKILVRDTAAENEILSYFSDFDIKNNMFILNDDDLIYSFLKHTLPQLSQRAAVYTSELLKKIDIHNDAEISVNVMYNEKINLLETEIESDLDPEEIAGILNAVRLGNDFYRMKNGSFFDIADNDIPDGIELLDKLNFNKSDIKSGKKKIPLFNAMYINSLKSDDVITTDSSFDEFISKIISVKADIPDKINRILRAYQREGVHWLKQLSSLGFGGILADDMGLGKTLQVIAFVCAEKSPRPALIVTPSSLTYNWQSEISRFAPEAKVIIIDGTKEEREKKLSDTSEFNFVITSYPLLRRDIAMYESIDFSYMFIDEAQYIKNPKTMNARSVKRVKADGYFALTGTPVENSLTELWSIFDYVMPGYLYSHGEFTARYEKAITKDNSTRTMNELRTRIKPFVMRRMKSEVLSELPEKIENTMLADLLPEQRRIYDAYLIAAKSEAVSIIENTDKHTRQLRILSLLMRLRQICCHPVLFDTSYKKDSGKLEMLEEITKSAHDAGHRILVFSQFTSMLAIIRRRFEAMGLECFYLDGATPSIERNFLADRFNSGKGDVFLVSLKAGGTGLNLIGADTVIHYDPWWNPAVMDQASDRAYRIGQTKAVQVIKLAARNTIEEKIIKLQDKKRVLADGIIRANTAVLSNLTKEEILALFE